MTATALQTRICLDDEGRAWIEGANTRVLQIAMDQYAHGWTAEEIHAQHPHLSLAQIHAALSYYHDHKAQMDAEIEAGLRENETLQAQAGMSKAEMRLRQQGLLS
jgi:uncharacterized protein (DUF433 family)